MRFEGKKAVVTGGASGIGKATALRLARDGAEVWIGDVDDAGLRDVAAASSDIHTMHCDVTQPGDIEALVAAAEEAGGIDYLCNNAGASGSSARIDSISAEDWDHAQVLLVRSVAMGIRYAAPFMAKRGYGAIVNTASVLGVQAGAAPIAYSVAKAGVIHLSRVAAAQLSRHGIRVNSVAPGTVLTNVFTRGMKLGARQHEAANQFIAEALAKVQPIKRAGLPEDVASAIAYLLSDEASFVTGTNLIVDGGAGIGSRHSWDPDAPNMFDGLTDAIAQVSD